MNRVKWLAVVVSLIVCVMGSSDAQEIDLNTQSIEIATENVLKISGYVDAVQDVLEASNLPAEVREQTMVKFQTLSVLRQAAEDVLNDLLAQTPKEDMDGLAENAVQLGDIAEQIYLEQIPPTLESVFENLDGSAAGQSASGGEGGIIPNIYANIGQTPIYQAVMNELHDTFRQSATPPEGGGFGESDATPN